MGVQGVSVHPMVFGDEFTSGHVASLLCYIHACPDGSYTKIVRLGKS